MTEDDRTTSVGLFHYAHTYASSARELAKLDLEVSHPDSPVRFLYSHAIELYLKAYLRAHGVTVKELRYKPYGHDTKALLKKAEEFGLSMNVVQGELIEHITNDTGDRYIVTGVRTIIPAEAFDDVCKSLHKQTGPDTYKDQGLTRSPISYK